VIVPASSIAKSHGPSSDTQPGRCN
jgi:hypothetical protein